MYQGLGYIIAIIIFSFLYNIFKFFELKTVYPALEQSYMNETMNRFNWLSYIKTKQFLSIRSSPAEVQLTDLRKNPVYATTFIICNTFFMGKFYMPDKFRVCTYCHIWNSKGSCVIDHICAYYVSWLEALFECGDLKLVCLNARICQLLKSLDFFTHNFALS